MLTPWILGGAATVVALVGLALIKLRLPFAAELYTILAIVFILWVTFSV